MGCAHSYVAAPKREAVLGPGTAAQAYAELSSSRGPDRFAQVTPTLYRGAQPNAEQIALMRDIGIKTIVTFITDQDIVRQETAEAARVGITVKNYPFRGTSSPDPAMLRRIVAELARAEKPIYIHCKQGRDRTSLVAALYRVLVQGWDPDKAWREEALAFGHTGMRNFWFRGLDHAYAQITHRG